MKHCVLSAGLIAILALLSLQPNVFGIGIGIAPNDITITDALRGTEYARTLTIFNPGDTPDNFTLSVEGYASEWISFHDLADQNNLVKNIVIAENDKQSIIAKITPPQDEAVGTYNATIYVKTIPPASNGTDVEVKAVLMANTLVTVELTGEQIVDGVVNLVRVEEGTEPGYPLRIGTSFKNTGNVVARPEISVSILKDGSQIESFTYTGARIKPETTETITAEWNTTSADSIGEYLADVAVSLDGRELAAESIPFNIMPTGTFTRQGNFTKLAMEDAPLAGASVKINAYFANTGRIDALAKFSGEVYRNGSRIDSISSDELLVAPGKETPLASYITLSSPGNYSIKGRIVYSGKETETKEIYFTVPEKSASSGESNKVTGMVTGAGGIYAAVAIVVVLGAVIIYRRRSKDI